MAKWRYFTVKGGAISPAGWRKNTVHVVKSDRYMQEFRTMALRTRDRHRLTQSGMADALCMSLNSYSEIEAGASGVGLLTGILLLSEQEDSVACLRRIREELEAIYKDEMAETAR